MIHIFGCDHEPVFLDIIDEALEKCSCEKEFVYAFHRFASADEMNAAFEEMLVMPSLVFIDAECDKTAAEKAIDYLRRHFPDCCLIVLSRYEDNDFLAFDLHADMFILKSKLIADPDKYLSHILPKLKSCENKTVTLEVYRSERTTEKMVFRLSDIVFLECIMKKPYITLRNLKCCRIKCRTWKEVVEKFCMLPFAVPHSNYVVNMNYITRITSEAVTLRPSCKEISLSKHRRKTFNELFAAYSCDKFNYT